MPKAGKKNHIFGDFFSEATKKNAKTGKEFGIEGKKETFTITSLSIFQLLKKSTENRDVFVPFLILADLQHPHFPP